MHKVLLGVLLLLFGNVATAQTRNSAIYNGNKAYEKGAYKEAEANYRKAFETQKSNEAAYNLGNALYEQKSYPEAAKSYEHSAKNSQKKELRAKAWHNKGNTDLSEKKYAEAIDAYKKALRENPSLNDARYNLAYAQAMLKKNQAPPPSQQKQDEKKQQNEEQPKEKPNEKPEDKQGEHRGEEPKNKSGEQAPSPQPARLNKAQADELLNALQREEKKVREKKEKQKGHPVSPEKDW